VSVHDVLLFVWCFCFELARVFPPRREGWETSGCPNVMGSSQRRALDESLVLAVRKVSDVLRRPSSC
jgi:hypothetical protein